MSLNKVTFLFIEGDILRDKFTYEMEEYPTKTHFKALGSSLLIPSLWI